MPDWLVITLSIAGGILLIWLILVAILWIQQRSLGTTVNWREMLRLVPDVIRLLSRLIADATVPRSVRWVLGVLLGYLLLPIDLVPDFLPVIGYADDAVIVALAIRFAIRRAGIDAIERHWPGTPAGLRTVLTLVGHADRT